ncbi:MAG: hypothetical protein KGI60_03090 [Patescibacteria group bacterium]|nr:hypothetical protein [Patescibacteria group bacterium]
MGIGVSISKMLEAYIGPQWMPVIPFLGHIALASSIPGLIIYYIYRTSGKQSAVGFLFLIAGMHYIEIGAIFSSDYRPYTNTDYPFLALLCTFVGFLLFAAWGHIAFGGDDDDDPEGDPDPDPGNKKVVDDFLKSCQKKFLAELRK